MLLLHLPFLRLAIRHAWSLLLFRRRRSSWERANAIHLLLLPLPILVFAFVFALCPQVKLGFRFVLQVSRVQL